MRVCATRSSASRPPTSRCCSKARAVRARSSSHARSTRWPPSAPDLRRGQLRGARRDAARGGAVRHRGSHGDRRQGPAREIRARRQGHAVPGRGCRPVTVGTGQAAARDPGPLGRTGRRQGRPRVDMRIVAATNRSLRSMVERAGFARISTTVWRRRDLRAAAPRASGRHSAAREPLPGAASANPAALALRARAEALSLRLAGQRPRAGSGVERAVALAGAGVERDDLLPARGDTGSSAPRCRRDDTMRAWGSRYVRLVLERCDGNKREACGARHQLSHAPGVPRVSRTARRSRRVPLAAWPAGSEPENPDDRVAVES